MRIVGMSVLALLCFSIGCGGGSSTLATSPVSGAYEFVVTSNVTGSTTLVEVNLSADGNQSKAAGPSEVQVLALENKTWYLNGLCFGATPGQNSLTTNLSGNNVAVTFNEGGNAFGAAGVLTGTTLSGNYSVSDRKCPDLIGIVDVPTGFDSGGFIGNAVPPLAGTFSGSLNFPAGTENTALTLTEAKDHSLKVKATLTGIPGNGTFQLSGSAVGNVMFVSGMVNGQNISLFGFFDSTGSLTGMPKSLQVFDYSTLTNLGLLMGS